MTTYTPPITTILFRNASVKIHLTPKYTRKSKSVLAFSNVDLSEVENCFILEWKTEYGTNTSVIPKEQVLVVELN